MSRNPSTAPSAAGVRKRSTTVSSITSSIMKLREPGAMPPPAIPATPLRVGDFAVLTPSTDALATQPVQLNHEMWPGLHEGDYVRVTVQRGEQRGASVDGYMFRWSHTLGTDKHNSQVVFNSAIAAQFGFNRDVRLTKVQPDEYGAEYVEIYFQDQYLGRSDMWRATNYLVGQCVHVDQKVTYAGVTDATVKAIYVDQQKVQSATVLPSTKIIFRSLSAKITLFIQVCRELWHFSDDGERYYEKLVHSFLPTLFDHWRDLNTNHVVTIVLVSRVFYSQSEIDLAAGPLRKDDTGRDYKDFFKVLVDLEVFPENDWRDSLVTIKQSLWTFQRDILLTHHYHRVKNRAESRAASAASSIHGDSQISESLPGSVDGDATDGATGVPILGTISSAQDGPILEALNLALNPTEKHYIDRALSITGTTNIFITPGTGHFAVPKHLLQLTTCRVLDQGFGLDLVCLSKPPLHRSPVFSFKSAEPGLHKDSYTAFTSKPGASTGGSTRRLDPLWGGDLRDEHRSREKATYYWEPPWVSVSFWDTQMDMPMRPDRFVSRCRIHDVQMMSLLESDLLAAIEIPFLQSPPSPKMKTTRLGTSAVDQRKAAQDAYDRDTFGFDGEDEPEYGPSPRLVDVSGSAATSSGGSTIMSASYKTIRDRAERERSNRPTPLQTPVSGSPPAETTLASKRNSRIQAVPTITETPETPSPVAHPVDSMTAAMPRNGTDKPVVPRESSPLSLASKATSWFFGSFRSSSTQPVNIPTPASHDPRFGGDPPSRPPSPTKPMSIKSSSTPLEIRGGPASRRAKSGLSRQFSEEDAMTSRLHQARVSPSATPPQSLGSGSLGTRAAKAMLSSRGERVERKPVQPNPSKRMTVVPYAQASLARRWQHIFPRPVFQHTMKWRSMAAPACLPLTVQFLPAAAELELDFKINDYSFIVNPPDMKSFLVRELQGPLRDNEDTRNACALAVLRGMAALRLAQGFQFVLDPDTAPPDAPGVGSSSYREPVFLSARPRGHSSATANPPPKNKCNGVSDILRDPRKPVYLSMSNEVHRLSYNGEQIEVKKYLRRMPFGSLPFDYSCLVWPKEGEGYSTVRTSFAFPNLETYGWNRLDMLVAGYEGAFHDSLRYWRTRFLVIPSRPPLPDEGLNEEEIRLKGADRLAELLNKARWVPSPSESVAPLRFVATTLGPAACVLDAAVTERIEQLHREGPLGKRNTRGNVSNLGPAQLAAIMREAPKDIPIRNYRWHSNTYHDAFTGSDLVSWLVREFKDVHTREQAAEIAANFHHQRLFTHCRDRHGFLDGNYFYQLTPLFARGRTASRPSFLSLQPSSLEIPRSVKFQHDQHHAVGSLSPKPQLLLSQTCVIDVDSARRSDQAERVIMHHDVIHNPANAFHFQLEWMGTTAKCIQDMVRSWNRAIERSGLRIVEGYVDQITSIRTKNVFQSCLPITLAVLPPALPPGTLPEGVRADTYFECALLRKFEFILDLEAGSAYSDKVDVVYSYRASPVAYTQFVHRTGAAFVQVMGGRDGFRWLRNRLLQSERSPPGTAAQYPIEEPGDDIEATQAQLEAFCADEEQLQAFYDETFKSIPLPTVSPTASTIASGISGSAIVE